MKKTILLLVTGLISVNAIAFEDKIPRDVTRLPEICQLETEFSDRLFEAQSFDILKMPSLDEKLLKMVNAYLDGDEAKTKDMSLEEIKAFIRGEYSSYDLGLTLLKHRTSGKEYVYVNSYPGDNEFGLYFDAKTGDVVADNGDGSITLNTNHGQISCYDLIKD